MVALSAVLQMRLCEFETAESTIDGAVQGASLTAVSLFGRHCVGVSL